MLEGRFADDRIEDPSPQGDCFHFSVRTYVCLLDAYLPVFFELLAPLEAVELLDRTRADAVGLSYGVGRLAVAADVVLGVALPALLLALDVNRLARQGLRLLVLQVVEAAQVARRDAELAADVLERVVRLGS